MEYYLNLNNRHSKIVDKERRSLCGNFPAEERGDGLIRKSNNLRVPRRPYLIKDAENTRIFNDDISGCHLLR